MEQLFLIIQQIYKLLNILSSYTQDEREELLVGYQCFLFKTNDILIALDRIIGGSTYWGWKIDWGYQPWQLRTYRQQKGLTLQAGWEDRVDFGLDLYRDMSVVPQRIPTPIPSPEVLTPIDLNALETEGTRLDPLQIFSRYVIYSMKDQWFFKNLYQVVEVALVIQRILMECRNCQW